MGRIALDHGEIVVLTTVMEAEPKPEAVGKRDLFFDGFGGIDRGRALILHHVARHHVAAVRGGVEKDVWRPSLDAAFERGFQGFVAGVVAVEAEVVAEEEEAPLKLAQPAKELRQRSDVLARDFYERDAIS